MRLNRHSRENYQLQITTTASDGNPIPPGGWEASFDGGTVYIAAEVVTVTEPWLDAAGATHEPGDLSAWLVAGPDAEEGTAVAVLDRSMRPLLRAVDSPEIIVRDAPRIFLH